MENAAAQALIPVMNATAVSYITGKLVGRKDSAKEYFIFEYGSGHSTKFFVDRLVRENIAAHYVAVERDPRWYSEMLAYFPGGTSVKHRWSFKDYLKFIKSAPQNIWDVPHECMRLAEVQRNMASPQRFIKFLLARNSFWFDAVYRTQLGCLDFSYCYIFESFKDQYGESPHKSRYIGIPLEGLHRALKAGTACHAAVMIDGGPRADIDKEMFSLIDTYKHLTVDIFLLDAHRGYYQQVISSRPGGRFVAAEKNKMADGRTYLNEAGVKGKESVCTKLMGVPNVRDALQRELWHFTNTR